MYASVQAGVHESSTFKMDIQRSRNGFYTLTFLNRNNLSEDIIAKDFNSVGKVCNIIQNNQRIFIRYREKEEAERAIITFGKIYEVDMAKNNRGEYPGFESNNRFNHKNVNKQIIALSSSDISSSSQTLDKPILTNKGFHLILGNLPKNYTLKDVNALVEEANPVYISPFEATRVFNSKFCQIVLNSYDSLLYLVDKLNGFVISGEKLIAVELKNLLEWREKMA